MKPYDLMMGHTELSKDKREIDGAYYGDHCNEGWEVGRQGIQKIIAFDDHGVGDWMPWLAIIKGGRIISKMPAWKCLITYKEN